MAAKAKAEKPLSPRQIKEQEIAARRKDIADSWSKAILGRPPKQRPVQINGAD